MFGDAIKSMMREVLDERKPQEKETRKTEFYTRKQVCQMLDICRATFHNWSKKGVFKIKKIGGRVYVFADKFDADMAEDKFVKFKVKERKS